MMHDGNLYAGIEDFIDLFDESDDDDDDSDADYDFDRVDDCSSELKSARDRVNWTDARERRKFLRRCFAFAIEWHGPLPDLRGIFHREEMDWLLSEASKPKNMYGSFGPSLLGFVLRTGYRDEPPLVDEAGKPILTRCTPIHLAARCANDRFPNWHGAIRRLFDVYDSYDANYRDERGMTHFHVACMCGFSDVVRKFLERGQDPNCRAENSAVPPPLHLALTDRNKEVASLLLKHGADPSATNGEGETCLHVVCRYCDHSLVEMVFENDTTGRLRVDARDKLGRTPLHLAVARGYEEMIEALLKRGADPSSASSNGMTPLHIVCMPNKYQHDRFVKTFFEITEGHHIMLQVDAKDSAGRTPLQLAVANLLPDVVDVLLDRGADLSSFVFPTHGYFAERFQTRYDENWWSFELRLTSGALMVVERLERRGFKLSPNDALIVMELFARYDLFVKKSAEDREEKRLVWYDDEEFASDAKHVNVGKYMSLDELIRLEPEEAAKRYTIEDYYGLSGDDDEGYPMPEKHKEACTAHLCETMSRGFFRRKAVEFLSKLTTGQRQLPILCCEKVVENLSNKDVWNMGLAATGQKYE